MYNRQGALLLMMDLPMKTSAQRRAYRRFRAEMKRIGFCSIQESVYVCLLRNSSSAQGVARFLGQTAPKEGSVQLLPMSLMTFSTMTAIRGPSFDFAVFADDVLLITN